MSNQSLHSDTARSPETNKITSKNIPGNKTHFAMGLNIVYLNAHFLLAHRQELKNIYISSFVRASCYLYAGNTADITCLYQEIPFWCRTDLVTFAVEIALYVYTLLYYEVWYRGYIFRNSVMFLVNLFHFTSSFTILNIKNILSQLPSPVHLVFLWRLGCPHSFLG